MKAIDLIKNNIFTLLKSGCSNNEIYEAIQELEDLHAEQWDFAVVGEDGAIVFEPHYVKFSTYTMIEEL